MFRIVEDKWWSSSRLIGNSAALRPFAKREIMPGGHCFNIPACWGARSAFDAIDGVDTLSDNMSTLTTSTSSANTALRASTPANG
jgi:hypothetical protein